MRLGKLHMDVQKNWSAKGRDVHYVVSGSAIRPHRIKIDEEEGNIIMTHELGLLMVRCIVLMPIKRALMSHISPDFQLARDTPLGLRELDFLTLFPRLRTFLSSKQVNTLIANMIVGSLS